MSYHKLLELMRMRVLVVPGYTNSGPEHWQTLWEQTNPEWKRVQQDDWDHPVMQDWVARLDEYVSRDPGETIVIAHSLGCATVAHWAQRHARPQVVGALLVAPADVDRPGILSGAQGFEPMPMERLPFRSVVVASEDDPYVTPTRAATFAHAWGSSFVNAGRAGHINTAAGHGPWPQGEAVFAHLLARLRERQYR